MASSVSINAKGLVGPTGPTGIIGPTGPADGPTGPAGTSASWTLQMCQSSAENFAA